MEMHCISCKKYTANKNSKVRKTKPCRLMLLSNCTICGKKIDFYQKLRTTQF